MEALNLKINEATEAEVAHVEQTLQDEEDRKEAIKWAKRDWTTITVAMKIAGIELTEDQEADIKDHLLQSKLDYVKGVDKYTSTGRKLAF